MNVIDEMQPLNISERLRRLPEFKYAISVNADAVRNYPHIRKNCFNPPLPESEYRYVTLARASYDAAAILSGRMDEEVSAEIWFVWYSDEEAQRLITQAIAIRFAEIEPALRGQMKNEFLLRRKEMDERHAAFEAQFDNPPLWWKKPVANYTRLNLSERQNLHRQKNR